MKLNLNRAWAILFARLVLGLIFFMAGVMKVFRLGPLEHARKYFLPFSDTFLPIWSLWVMGVAIPFVELIAGALVLLGLRTRDALVALGAVLVVVTFGHLLHDALFNFSGHVIPRLALLLLFFVSARRRPLFAGSDPGKECGRKITRVAQTGPAGKDGVGSEFDTWTPRFGS
jgi:uncharacterized membrane protein YphA (DoxX/SURF4 family)